MAERLEPTEPSTMALIAQTHALLAVASYLGAARVRPGATPWQSDVMRSIDEAAIDRARAREATEEQRGMRGERARMVIADEVDLGDEPGWHRASGIETHYYGDGHNHEPGYVPPEELPQNQITEEDA